MKSSEIRAMKTEDAEKKLLEIKKELFGLRMQHATGQVENPLQMRGLKRDIARINTIVAEKERETSK